MPRYMYECTNCELQFDKFFPTSDKRTETTTCPRCKGRSYFHFGATIKRGQKSTGNHWKATGGFNGKNSEVGSLSRAVFSDQIEEQKAEDKRLGVDHLVEYNLDRKGFARPCFRSKLARDKWDKAHGFYDRS